MARSWVSWKESIYASPRWFRIIVKTNNIKLHGMDKEKDFIVAMSKRKAKG